MYWYNYGFYTEKPNELAILLTDEEYNKLMTDVGNGGELLQDKDGRPYVKLPDDIDERMADNIRITRSALCFPIINRGALWYDKLTAKQKTELEEWYQGWLDAPETKVIPEKPEWLE